MICSCGEKTQVYDSKVIESGTIVWRRRKCPICKIRFTTYEKKENVDEELKRLIYEQQKDDVRVHSNSILLIEEFDGSNEWDDPVAEEFLRKVENDGRN